MRRKPGTLIPIEAQILEVGLELRRSGEADFHGFRLAKALAGDSGKLTSHGTLYKALGRLEAAGLVASVWEDADTAVREGRPRRRMYEVTGAAAQSLAAHRAAQSERPSWARAPGVPGLELS